MTDTRDTPGAALAAALHEFYGDVPADCVVGAEHILAALDGWTLVPTTLTPRALVEMPTEEYATLQQAYRAARDAELEVARLRTDLEAACVAMEAATAKLREVGR